MKALGGLTLVEVLVAALILSFVVGVIFQVLNIGNISSPVDLGLLELQQQSRQAMDRMIREIRQASPANTTISNNLTTIIFSVPNTANNITYYLNATSHQIIRQQPASTGTQKITGNDISNLTFCCWYNNTCDAACSNTRIVQISIESAKSVLNKPLSFNLTEKARLRNE